MLHNKHSHRPLHTSHHTIHIKQKCTIYIHLLSTPTRKSNVLDLIFCSDEIIKSVDVSECSFSDHCLIKTETYIPVDPITIQANCINPSLTSFEKFDFNRSDWINLSQSLKFTNWIHELDQVSPDEILPVAMNILHFQMFNPCAIKASQRG